MNKIDQLNSCLWQVIPGTPSDYYFIGYIVLFLIGIWMVYFYIKNM